MVARFSLPLFLKVPEPPRGARPGEQSNTNVLAAAFGRLGRTFREIRRYRHAFMLFLAMLLYQDGIQTIIRMASVIGAEIGIDQNAQIAAFVMVQFLGIPFAFLFGTLGTRIGTKQALFIALAVYTLTAILGYFMKTRHALLLAGGLCRNGPGGKSGAQPGPVFARLIPAKKASEFFGFYAVAERFATVLGPLVFTLSVALTGSSRTRLLFIIAFFAAGAALAMVDEKEGCVRRRPKSDGPRPTA